MNNRDNGDSRFCRCPVCGIYLDRKIHFEDGCLFEIATCGLHGTFIWDEDWKECVSVKTAGDKE